MNILIITQKINDNDSILGFFCDWLKSLANKADNIYVMALEIKNTDLAKNIQLYSLGKENSNSNRLKCCIKFNQALINICLKEKIDIIFIHMCPEYAILAWPYAKLKGIPMVMWYAHGGVNIYLRIAHCLVDNVITSSKHGFRINSDKLEIIGQGIDIEKFRINNSKLKNKDKKLILSVGRISPIKDYETLIKAADILINQMDFRNLSFQIIGGFPLKYQERYLDSLKSMVTGYNLQGHIQFMGPVSYTEIENYYQNCDLFVNTSCASSLEKTVLEAMACGKLTLTCNDAFEDMLSNYSKKLIFERRNAMELAQKIISNLQMEEYSRDGLVLSLRNMVAKEHNLNGLTDRLINLFQCLIEDKGGIKK